MRDSAKSPPMKYFLGVDGGASKTAALVINDTGKSLGSGVAGPSNHLRVGIETAARNIERAVNKALVTADVASREIHWAYCGIAGADHPAHRQEVVDSLSIFFPRGNFTVDNDARIALTGAIGFGGGVVVIAGAGRELAAAALAVARRLHMVNRAFPVAYVGGAFRAGEILLGPMRAAILAEAPKAEIGPPKHTPAEGAAEMAMRAAVSPRP